LSLVDTLSGAGDRTPSQTDRRLGVRTKPRLPL